MRMRKALMLPLNVVVPIELRAAVLEVADAEGVSVSEATRNLLRSGLQARELSSNV